MKVLSFLTIVSVLFFACEKRKNNKTENKLEGSWELVKSEYGDNEMDISDRKQIVTFYDNLEEYAISNEGLEADYHHGDMTFTYSDNFTYSLKFFYAAVEKGKELHLVMEVNSPGAVEALMNNSMFSLSNPTIKKLSKKKFVMEGKNPDGFVSKFTFSRI